MGVECVTHMPMVGQMAVNYNVNGIATKAGNIESSPRPIYVYSPGFNGCDMPELTQDCRE